MANLAVIAMGMAHLKVTVTTMTNLMMEYVMPIGMLDSIITMANLTVIATSLHHLQVIITIVIDLMMDVEGHHTEEIRIIMVIIKENSVLPTRITPIRIAKVVIPPVT